MLYILLKLKFNMHPSLCLSFTIDICTIPYQCGCYWVAAIQHPFHILRVPTKDIFTNTWGLHDQGWKVEWHVMWNILRPGPVTALGGVVSTEAFHCTTNWMQQKKTCQSHFQWNSRAATGRFVLSMERFVHADGKLTIAPSSPARSATLVWEQVVNNQTSNGKFMISCFLVRHVLLGEDEDVVFFSWCNMTVRVHWPSHKPSCNEAKYTFAEKYLIAPSNYYAKE